MRRLARRLGDWIARNGRHDANLNTLAGLHLLHAGQLEPGLEAMGRASEPYIEPFAGDGIGASRARGYYCVLRGKYARAIALLDADEEPRAHCGWAQARGMLARAHNALGEYQRAREICVEALSCLTSADLEFVVWNLGVEIELAMAESGLGNHAEAARQLDELISKHARCAGRSRWVRCTMPEHALR